VGKKSTKENKNIYQMCREDLGLSRQAAADLLEVINEDRIERIEKGALPRPDEIVIMAEKYGAPYLHNYYCVNECEIGQKYVPAVEPKELPRITLEMLAIMNRLTREKERLIEITFDGEISEAELPDFVALEKQLDDMAAVIASLKLWVQTEIGNERIDREKYEQLGI